MEEVKMTKEAYRKMQRRIDKLDALEAGGVDNWEWFDESLKDWRKENEIDELADDFLENMNELTIEADVDFPAGRDAGHSITLPQEAVRKLFLSFIEKYKEIEA